MLTWHICHVLKLQLKEGVHCSVMDSTYFMMCLAIFFISLPLHTKGKCVSPKVLSTSTYTTPDVLFSSDTVYSIILSVTCQDNQQPSLYALIDDQLIPVTKELGTNQYQISWTRPHDKPLSGSLVVSFYDDEGASSFRKSIRYEEEIKVSPLFDVTLDYKGIKKASLIAPGFIAMCLALLVWYLANTTRQKLQQ